jgi:hypothetical protein
VTAPTTRAGPTRRRLLAAALAAAGGVAVAGGWWAAVGGRRFRRREARFWIDERFLDSAARLGEEHLAATAGFDPEAVWRALDELLGPWPATGLGDERFRARVRAAVESDFAAEATVDLRGYRFSLTEARLCALVALAARRPRGGAA